MNDRETADLQDQIITILGLIEELRSAKVILGTAIQVYGTVLQEHLQTHKENQDAG